MDDLEIITTADGSHTLRNKQLDETYHSVHGAIQESIHVFIQNGLDFYQKVSQSRDISILEIGLGTGLNALLTMQYARINNVHVRYTTLEPFPLPRAIWSNLNYPDKLGDLKLIHETAWDEVTDLTPEFTLSKKEISLQDVKLTDPVAVIFFDAFAPSVQPDLWRIDNLKKVTDMLVRSGTFVTYSAKGQLKRDLRALDLKVETLPGPPGKLEMVRAQRA